MTEWEREQLNRWVDDLENPVFVSMQATERSGRIVLTAEQLLERYPEPDDGELLSWLRKQRPGGVFHVMRDKWARLGNRKAAP